MKTRKVLSLFLALALVFSFVPAAFADALTPAEIEDASNADAVAEATEEVFMGKHNFGGQDASVSTTVDALTVKSTNLLDANGAPITPLFNKTDYQIDFLNEKLIINEDFITADGSIDETSNAALYPVKFISFDGGNKWAPVTIPAGGLDISKQLNKSVTIMLTSNLDTTVKPNVPKEGSKVKDAGKETEVAAVNGNVTYTFTATAARPKAEKFKPNFLTYGADITCGNGQWSVPDGVDTTKLDISVADSTGKAPTYGWFRFPNGTAGTKSIKAGIAIQDLVSGKPSKIVYLVRLAPDAKTMTPASAPFKLGVPTVQKAPAFKIDYKKEIIKVKADTVWGYAKSNISYVNSIGQLVDEEVAVLNDTLVDGYTEIKGTVINEVIDSKNKPVNMDTKGALIKMDKEAAKAGIALAKDTYSLYGESLAVRIGATEKKPASAIQIIDVAPQTQLFQVDFKPSFAKGKMIVDKKTYEFYDDGKSKWGGAPKEAGTYKVRVKNTAKYDVKGNKTTGNVNSAVMEVTLISGSFDDKKPEKTGLVGYTVKSFPKYEGMIWVESVTDGAASPKAVTALDINSKLNSAKDGSEYNTYKTTGLTIEYTLKQLVDGEDVEFEAGSVLLNPEEATLTALSDGAYHVVVAIENEALLGEEFDAEVADGVLALTVKADATAEETLQDLEDSIAVSLYYAPTEDEGEDGDAEAIAEAAYKTLLAGKLNSKDIPVTVTEPRITFTVPTFIADGATVSLEEILLSEVEDNSIVITVTPNGTDVFLNKASDPELAVAADFALKVNGTAYASGTPIAVAAETTVITITVPDSVVVGDTTIELGTVSASKVALGAAPVEDEG